MLFSRVVDRGFEPPTGQTNDYDIGICFFPQSMHHSGERAKTGWLGIRIMCPSGATYQPVIFISTLGTGSPLVNEKETGVFLAKGCKVPPNSVMRVGAQMSESMAGEYIVKAATKGELLIPRTLHKGGDNPVLCLINLSDHYVELEKGEVFAYAEEVCSKVEPVGIRKVEPVGIQKVEGF